MLILAKKLLNFCCIQGNNHICGTEGIQFIEMIVSENTVCLLIMKIVYPYNK